MTQLRLGALAAELTALSGQLLRRILVLLTRRLIKLIVEADVDDLATAPLVPARLARERMSWCTGVPTEQE